MTSSFEMELTKIQPSQLYISIRKLAKIKKIFDPEEPSTLGVIPIKKIGNDIIYVDGHTRAFAAYQAGFTKISVIWEDEEWDWEMYKVCIKWCKDEGIYSISDLNNRVIKHKDYKILWYKRCNDLHNKLTAQRTQKNNKNKS